METKTNGNGYVKWPQLVTIAIALLGIIITIGIFMSEQAIAIDQRALERYESNRELFHCIDKRLARIEEKLGVAFDEGAQKTSF